MDYRITIAIADGWHNLARAYMGLSQMTHSIEKACAYERKAAKAEVCSIRYRREAEALKERGE